jgi:hypothetical protein
MIWLKLAGSIVCFIVAFFCWRDIRNKKILRMGDNQFFIENPNGISSTKWLNSWLLVFWAVACGIILIDWAF